MNSARTWGGTEKWTRMATESLAENGHGVSLVYRHPVVGEKFRVKKQQLPCLSHIDLYTLFRLVRTIRKEHIEVIIPTKRKDYLLAGLAARLCGITNILRLGIERHLHIPLIHRLIYHTFADGIIVNAEKIRNALLESPFMKKENIRIIYNGVDTETIDKLGFPASVRPFSFTIATAGVLTNRKGQEILIRSFSRFLESVPEADAELVIMGEGPKRQELQQLSETLGIESRVVFTGFLDNPYPYMAAGDVFVMTSSSEGISNALLEAMYLKCVPVSTPAGGTGELIREGENGFLIEHSNETELAALLAGLYRKPDLRSVVGAAARQTVIERFSLETMQEKILVFCLEKASEKLQP